jgi:Zn-dependent M16 (insulinase) family peptidase
VLAKIKQAMSPEDLARVVEETKALKARQAAADSADDVAKLPRLSLEDLDRREREIPIEVDTRAPAAGGGGAAAAKGVTYLRHELPTSGILYADVCFDARALDLEDAPLLPLLTNAFLETGTARKDRVTLSQEIGTHTGGLRTATLLSQPAGKGGAVAAPDSLFAYVCVRGKAVAAKADRLFALVSEVVSEPKLDDQRRVVEMLKEAVAGYRASIPSAGHSYVDMRLRAKHSAAGYIADASSGIGGFEQAKAALAQAETDWPALCARLQAMRAKLIASDGIVINLTGDASVLAAAQPHAEAFASSLPSSAGACASSGFASAPFSESAVNEGMAVPTQVNYVAKGGQLFKPGEKVRAGALCCCRCCCCVGKQRCAGRRCCCACVLCFCEPPSPEDAGDCAAPLHWAHPFALREQCRRLTPCPPHLYPPPPLPFRWEALPPWSPSTCARATSGTRCA